MPVFKVDFTGADSCRARANIEQILLKTNYQEFLNALVISQEPKPPYIGDWDLGVMDDQMRNISKFLPELTFDVVVNFYEDGADRVSVYYYRNGKGTNLAIKIPSPPGEWS